MTEIFSIIKDIALSGAAGVTSYVAFSGLSKWQKELSGKAGFDVARDLAKSVYALRDEISYCRSAFTAAHEFPEDYKWGGERDSEEEGRAWAHVYAKRWGPVGKAMRDFDAAALEAEALWGEDIRCKADALRRCVVSLQVDIKLFINDKYSGGKILSNRKLEQKVQSTVWALEINENKLSKEIGEAIESLESAIRPHLSRG